MASDFRAESLRVLCLDGGGIKGYTSLLILKRIFRTMMAEGQLDQIPRPCDVFDLIVGTSTGGLIAVMLGRLHMTIDECITHYEQVGKEVFGRKPPGGKLGKMIMSLGSSAFYDIENLQTQIKKVLDTKEVPQNTQFREAGAPSCKVMLCVTRSEIGKPDVLRNYESLHPTTENYNCTIWEAASATAAAPLYFKGVKFSATGEKWCDGGLRRNNPINEALSELSRERDWKDKKIGCLVSVGTGIKKNEGISSSLSSIMKGVVAMVTDSDDTARVFASSELGIELYRTHRYFRLTVPQGMQELRLDEWKETEKMRALTTDYLNHMGSGDIVTRCAKSLLDPDENFNIEIKHKPSLIPYNPCTHFVERPALSDRLLKYFRAKSPSAQTFVLWGLGGSGKTQVALKFAQTIKHRLSVFWIRADNFQNFVTDYAQVLKQLEPDGQKALPGEDLSDILDRTRRRLEEAPNQWLLILDNADDLDAFLGRGSPQEADKLLSISRFLPRQGRLLITTRDRRFQGTISAANDGMKVDPMSEDEAKDLLIRSIPRYLAREGAEFAAEVKQLVEELGYLPLAIAQAAANIVEQQLTLSEYVSFYLDKKQRMGLMQAPAHDFQTTDARNASQSVNITWQISFDVLAERHPLSAALLTYIGCFHWRNIPRMALQRLPEFRNLSEAEFILLTKKPVNLSLLDEVESEPGFVEYMVHPMVHERILHNRTSAEIGAYLSHATELLSMIFPFVADRTEPRWSTAVYLAPHAIRAIELCDGTAMSSRSLSVLLLSTSSFSGASNLFAAAVDLAEKAEKMGRQEWSSSANMILTFMCNTNDQYINAGKHVEAEAKAREALSWIDSDFVKSNMDPSEIEVERVRLQSMLSSSLISRNQHAERERLHRAQLCSGLVNEWNTGGIVIRHNLAHALYHQNKLDEARTLNLELLNFAMSEHGPKVVSRRLYLIMLNLRCMIMRTPAGGYNKVFRADALRMHIPEELLDIHRLVFKESIEQLGIEDIDTWKAINNLLGCLHMLGMQAESGPILMHVLPAGIACKIKAEGKYSATLREITGYASSYLHFLEHSGDGEGGSAEYFRKLFAEWTSSCGSSAARNHPNQVNTDGVHMQMTGLFSEAERHHQRAIDMCLEANMDVDALYRYNLMLAVARQGRGEEAMEYREKYKEDIQSQEAAFGKLEDRLEQDRRDREIYDEARDKMRTGAVPRDGEWWAERKWELSRAERRYGKLESRAASKPPEKGLKQRIKKR